MTDRTVHPGGFCAPIGDTGKTVAGTDMVCSPKNPGDRARWRRNGPPPARKPRRKRGAPTPAPASAIVHPQQPLIERADLEPEVDATAAPGAESLPTVDDARREIAAMEGMNPSARATLLRNLAAGNTQAGNPAVADLYRDAAQKAVKAADAALAQGFTDLVADRDADPEPSTPTVQTWEELGKPQGPSPVGQIIGHEGGTYERLPGELRRYRIIAADGRDISDQASSAPDRPQTADDARTALRVDAHDQNRIHADKNSQWRQALGKVTGSWSYDTHEVEGFDDATDEERAAIRGALARWTGDKANTRDAVRAAEPRVNSAIRGLIPHNETVDQDIRALKLALSKSRTTAPITVYRGFTSGSHILPSDWKNRNLEGLRWSSASFNPTTADPEAADCYVGNPEDRGFGIRLNLPAGTPAVAIPDAIGGMDNEGEILLSPDLTFRVVKDRGVEGQYGHRWLDVELVPAAPDAGA